MGRIFDVVSLCLCFLTRWASASCKLVHILYFWEMLWYVCMDHVPWQSLTLLYGALCEHRLSIIWFTLQNKFSWQCEHFFFIFSKAWAMWRSVYGLNAILLWKILLIRSQQRSNSISHILAQANTRSTPCCLFLDSYLWLLQNYWLWLFIYRLLKTHLFKRQPVLTVEGTLAFCAPSSKLTQPDYG